MTDTNTTKSSSPDSETNVIKMSDIVERDGKAGELFQNIAAAHENCDTLDEILELEKELDEYLYCFSACLLWLITRLMNYSKDIKRLSDDMRIYIKMLLE